MRWITRELIKVDRVACPWLIRKFVDADSEFCLSASRYGLEHCGRSCFRCSRC
jgi:hypothetical protein